MSPSPSQLPTETLDTIASHVIRKRDLLNFGLTCKRVFAVVDDRHLRYREIGPISTADQHKFWNDLFLRPDRTASIWRLKLILSTDIDKIYRHTAPSNVLGLMSNLIDLSVSDTHTAFGKASRAKEARGFALYEPREDDAALWTIFHQTTSLKSLHIFLDPRYPAECYPGITAGEKHFKWIGNNLNLQKLSIHVPKLSLKTSVFSKILLPKLRSFSIEADICLTGGHIETFFRNHPKLVELHWCPLSRCKCYPSPDITLNFLERITGNAADVREVLNNNIPSLNNIYCVKNYDFNLPSSKLNLEKLRIFSVDRLGSLANIYRLKHVEWLRVNGEELVWVKDEQNNFHKSHKLSLVNWEDILTHLPRLQVLRGVSLLGNNLKPDEVTARVITLCRLAPELSFIDHWNNQELAIRLTRKLNATVEWDFVDSRVADESVDQWRLTVAPN